MKAGQSNHNAQLHMCSCTAVAPAAKHRLPICASSCISQRRRTQPACHTLWVLHISWFCVHNQHSMEERGANVVQL
jgi:hypothetical protein